MKRDEEDRRRRGGREVGEKGREGWRVLAMARFEESDFDLPKKKVERERETKLTTVKSTSFCPSSRPITIDLTIESRFEVGRQSTRTLVYSSSFSLVSRSANREESKLEAVDMEEPIHGTKFNSSQLFERRETRPTKEEGDEADLRSKPLGWQGKVRRRHRSDARIGRRRSRRRAFWS